LIVPDIISGAASAATGRCAAPPAVFFDDFKSAQLGLARQEQLAEEITRDCPRVLLVWQAPQALIVGRSDTRLPRFAAAADRLVAEGWPVLIRRSGGSACPVSRSTLQIALARTATTEITIDSAYTELTNLIRTVLESYGLNVETCSRPNAFCPGRYDMSINGRKIAGLSQHWRQCNGRIAVTTASALTVEEAPEELAHIVNLFYRTAGGSESCSASAVGALRQALPVDATFDAPLVEDVRNRIAKAARAEWRNDPRRIPAPSLCRASPRHIDLDH
jgi:octanoyl-[GcvH]:protein N-octanoyltransferase